MSTLKDRVHECERRNPSITRAEIAKAAGVKQPSVADWFNGKTLRLKLAPAVGAARLWRCDPLWLGEGTGSANWNGQPVSGVPPVPSTSPPLPAALPVVLDAIERCPQRAELEKLLPLLVTGAPAYRQRLLELLTSAKRQANG